MNADWKFQDKPNTACFTTTFVLEGSPILRVYRDYEGDWQFHGATDQSADDSVGKIVALKEIVRLDGSVMELHDLPYGWAAERATPTARWRRFKNTPFASYEENGYYLEDALWLSEYLADINPPDQETRENLKVGEYVKLVFRFADEESDRKDGQCERMWVQVTGCDNQGYYVGRLENDPHHGDVANGDTIHFHPLHVADINVDD